MSRPARAKPDPELALEHARGAEPAAHHELHRLVEQVVAVVVGAVVDRSRRRRHVVAGDAVDVGRACVDLAPPVGDDLAHALLVDPRALDALGAARAGG